MQCSTLKVSSHLGKRSVGGKPCTKAVVLPGNPTKTCALRKEVVLGF